VFYEDLSPYRYSSVPTGLPGVVNVGWLGADEQESRGDVDPALVGKLRRFAETPALLMRGLHECGLCGSSSGNGEIWVTAKDGRVYASPTMLLHYVEHHRYLPPPEYLEALRGATAPLTDSECKARLARHVRKLDTLPTPEDILVPVYSTRIYWAPATFPDLRAFDQFVRAVLSIHGSLVALDEGGYFVETECEEPAGIFDRLAADLEPGGRPPVRCVFRLLFVGGEERVWPTAPAA